MKYSQSIIYPTPMSVFITLWSPPGRCREHCRRKCWATKINENSETKQKLTNCLMMEIENMLLLPNVISEPFLALNRLLDNYYSTPWTKSGPTENPNVMRMCQEGVSDEVIAVFCVPNQVQMKMGASNPKVMILRSRLMRLRQRFVNQIKSE